MTTSPGVIEPALVEDPTPHANDAAAVRAGQGRVRIVRAGRRSVVTRAFATSPLRLLSPRNHGPAAWIYTSSYGGGLVDGDCISLDVDVACRAAAFVSTQASTKAYRSPGGTQADVSARIGPEALLVMAPDPVVCFTGARYRQRQRFDVAEDGALVLVDSLVSGRCAAGERWAFEAYESRIDVVVGGRLAVHDPVALRASDGALAERVGRFDVLAVLILAGAPLCHEAAKIVGTISRQQVTRRPEQLAAAFPIGEHGCIVRIAGTSVERVRGTVRSLLSFVPERLEDDPWTRKW